MLNIWDAIAGASKDITAWIIDHGGNSPVFWLVLFFGCLLIGLYTIKALNKDK